MFFYSIYNPLENATIIKCNKSGLWNNEIKKRREYNACYKCSKTLLSIMFFIALGTIKRGGGRAPGSGPALSSIVLENASIFSIFSSWVMSPSFTQTNPQFKALLGPSPEIHRCPAACLTTLLDVSDVSQINTFQSNSGCYSCCKTRSIYLPLFLNRIKPPLSPGALSLWV